MDSAQKVVSTQKLGEWFRDRLHCESQTSSLPISEGTVSYLVQLLVHFSQSKNFFTHGEHGLTMPILAFLYRDANEASSTGNKLMILRQLGDSALFIGAMFPEKLGRVGIKKDYYIGMGGSAYSVLAEHNYGDPTVFAQLSSQFPRLLQMVATVCSRPSNFNAEEIFTLYQRWQTSHDHLLKKQLMSLGITTIDKNTFH